MYIFFLQESKKQKGNDNEENMLGDLRANRIKHRPKYNDDDPFDVETNADVYDFNEDDHASDASVSISNHDNYYKIQDKKSFIFLL